jgi:hypothetical protein
MSALLDVICHSVAKGRSCQFGNWRNANQYDVIVIVRVRVTVAVWRYDARQDKGSRDTKLVISRILAENPSPLIGQSLEYDVFCRFSHM